jgi:hypothetical protein
MIKTPTDRKKKKRSDGKQRVCSWWRSVPASQFLFFCKFNKHWGEEIKCLQNATFLRGFFEHILAYI